MIKYVIITIICLIISAYMYVNISFPFWSKQPVFHFYKPHYLLKQDTHILTKNSDFNAKRFIDYNKTFVFKFENGELGQQNDLLKYYFSLIRRHYLRDKLCKFEPTNKYLLDTLYSQSSYVSLYKQVKFMPPFTEEVISGLTSKQIILYRKNKNLSLRELYINYVDFLCTHYDHRKKYLTPKVIYMFVKHLMNNAEYEDKEKTQLKNNIDNSYIFMFKRESDKQSFVPFCSYNNYIFNIHKIQNSFNKPVPIFRKYKLNKISNTNKHLLYRCIEKIKSSIDNLVYMNIDTIMHYINSGILHIYVVVDMNMKEDPFAVYIYKNNCFKYKNNDVIELTNCIYFNESLYSKNKEEIKTTEREEILHEFFMKTVVELCKENKELGYISIENLCMNNIIIRGLKKENKELHKYQNNYYLYNYILLTKENNNIFMII